MVARCFGATPPPAARASDAGSDATHEAVTAVAGSTQLYCHTRHYAPLQSERAEHSRGADRAIFERTTRCAS
jgi:hypothetical protein